MRYINLCVNAYKTHAGVQIRICVYVCLTRRGRKTGRKRERWLTSVASAASSHASAVPVFPRQTRAALTGRVKAEAKTTVITSGEDQEAADEAVQTDEPAGARGTHGGREPEAAAGPRFCEGPAGNVPGSAGHALSRRLGAGHSRKQPWKPVITWARPHSGTPFFT